MASPASTCFASAASFAFECEMSASVRRRHLYKAASRSQTCLMSHPISARSAPVFLEASDAGRLMGLSAQTVKRLGDTGQLRIAARTTRGSRLFDPTDIERAALQRRTARQ
jgi:hypothetical protein